MLIYVLSKLFQRILHFGLLHEDWKLARLIPMHKKVIRPFTKIIGR